MAPVRWDGKLRTFDDPDRRPGEPWAAPFNQEGHDRLIAELDELRNRPDRFGRAAVACQGLMNFYRAERNEMITAAMSEGASAAALAAKLNLTRQHVYAIAAEGGYRKA